MNFIVIFLLFLHYSHVDATTIALDISSNIALERATCLQDGFTDSFEDSKITATISSVDFTFESLSVSNHFSLQTYSNTWFYNIYTELFLHSGYKQYTVYWTNQLINTLKLVILFPFHTFL